MDDPKWIFDPGKMRGDVCNGGEKKNCEGEKKIHNPLKLKSCSRVQNTLFSPLAPTLSLSTSCFHVKENL